MATVVVVAGFVDFGAPRVLARSPTEPSGGYRETIVPLPGFDPLSSYVYDNNCPAGPAGCADGTSNYSEVPVLANSPEQPSGIYYVDNASQLVDLNGTVRVVANVTPLDQEYAQYAGMLPNDFTLEYGYDEALFFGVLPPHGAVEAVNLTTGQVLLVTQGIPIASANQEAILIGPTTALVFSTVNACDATVCPATVLGVDLATGAEWNATWLPFFEANNIYWIPQLHELINVEAHGSTGDLVQQLDENPNGTFTSVAVVRDDVGAQINWVNGIAYNASAAEVAFSAGGDGYDETYVLQFAANGTLTVAGERQYYQSVAGVAKNGWLIEGQRYVYTGTWDMGPYVNGTQYLFDPWNGTTERTNEPFTDLVQFDVCDGACFLGQTPSDLSPLIDFHASVELNDPFWSVVVATLGAGETI